MIPLALSAGLGAASGLYGIFSGIHQQNMANNISAKRPKYSIPGEATNNVDMYRDLTNSTRIPGQSVAENRIRSGTANSLNALKTAGGGSNSILNNISQINANQNAAMNDLSVQGAQFQAMNRDKFAEANQVLAGYKDQEFDYNKNQPYMMAMARKMALQQAGAENINNGITGLSGLATSFIGQGGAGGAKTAKIPTGNRIPVSGFPTDQLYG